MSELTAVDFSELASDTFLPDATDFSTYCNNATTSTDIKKSFIEPTFSSCSSERANSLIKDLYRSNTTRDNLPSLNEFNEIIDKKKHISFIPKFEWTGVVEKVDLVSGLFEARVQDQLNSDIGEEIAELEIEELSQLNQSRLKKGAIFYWTIGYELIGKTKKKASKIVFKTTPNNLKCVEEIANKRAEDFTNFFMQFK